MKLHGELTYEHATKGLPEVENPLCLLTRLEALQQSISDYKHAVPVYMNIRGTDKTRNRPRTGQINNKKKKLGCLVSTYDADTHMNLLRSKTRPNTVWSRSSVLQFQRWCLNWC